jgi:hypothetical protein
VWQRLRHEGKKVPQPLLPAALEEEESARRRRRRRGEEGKERTERAIGGLRERHARLKATTLSSTAAHTGGEGGTASIDASGEMLSMTC